MFHAASRLQVTIFFMVALTVIAGIITLRVIINSKALDEVENGKTWTFDAGGEYSFDNDTLELASGRAQFKDHPQIVTGTSRNPGFDNNREFWDNDMMGGTGGFMIANFSDENLGNPGWMACTYTTPNNSQHFGSYYMQAHNVSQDHPETAVAAMDFKIQTLNLRSGDHAYVFLSVDDDPRGILTYTDAIWWQEITASGGWTSTPTIDVSSRISTAGIYYVKLGLWVDTAVDPVNPQRQVYFFYDNAEFSWSKTLAPTHSIEHETIRPIDAFESSAVRRWKNFSEEATKNGGEVYYQLSGDGGNSWQYYDGTRWTEAGTYQYNTVLEVDDHLEEFDASSKSLTFQAYLKARNDTTNVLLDSVSVEASSELGAPDPQAETTGTRESPTASPTMTTLTIAQPQGDEQLPTETFFAAKLHAAWDQGERRLEALTWLEEDGVRVEEYADADSATLFVTDEQGNEVITLSSSTKENGIFRFNAENVMLEEGKRYIAQSGVVKDGTKTPSAKTEFLVQGGVLTSLALTGAEGAEASPTGIFGSPRKDESLSTQWTVYLVLLSVSFALIMLALAVFIIDKENRSSP